MERITVFMKDGTRREFVERGRPGGSHTLRLKYEPGFAVIIDEYYNTVSIPVDDIKEIKTEAGRSW